MSDPRTPTAQELVQERIIRDALVVDATVVAGFLAIAFWSSSLTLGAEFLRGVILVSLTATALWLLVRVNRGRMSGYDFGTGKLERLVGLITAIAMVSGAVVLGLGILDRFVEPPSRSESGMSAAVAIVVVNFAANIWFLRKIARASRGHVSPVVEAERRSLVTKVVGSVVVVASVAMTALFRESDIGNTADLVGTAFVAGYMVWTAASMIREAMPDLLDKTLREDLQLEINRVLARHFDNYDGLGAVRSRHVGNRMIVEIELTFEPMTAIGVIEQRLGHIRLDLETALPGCTIVLIPRGTP